MLVNFEPSSTKVVAVPPGALHHDVANKVIHLRADKEKLKKMNEEESTLSNGFRSKLLAATKDAAYVTTDKSALAGLTDAEIGGAERAAKTRNVEGWVLPLQNTTQQPYLSSLSVRATRKGSCLVRLALA